jgi:hypothetical protein
MTINDVINIFGGTEIKTNEYCWITGEKFLEIGFKNAPDNPTKEELHNIDKGKMGYADLIENGNYS